MEQKFNLTAIDNDRDIIIKHFYDSLLCTKAWTDFSGKSLLILAQEGISWATLKILNPDLDVTLCDSLFKRITFLNEVIANLELENNYSSWSC